MRRAGAYLLSLALAGQVLSSSTVSGQEPAVPPPPVLDPTPVAPRITVVAPGGAPGAAPGVQVEAIVEGADFIVPQVRALGGGDGTFYFASPVMADSDSGLIQMEQVQKELELLDSQKEQIRKLQEQMHSETRKILEEMRGSYSQRTPPSPGGSGQAEGGAREDAERRAQSVAASHQEMSKRMRDVQEQSQKKIQDVLLPHQQQRLTQISLRMKMKNRGTVGALSDQKLAKDLDITDEQKDRLRKRAEKVQQELEKKIAKLREEAREEILDELSSTQKQKLKDLLGDEFELQPQRRTAYPSATPSRTVRPSESPKQ